MKAITIKQPWASLIVEGIKDIENRTWATKFRGRVLIHAGIAKTSGLMVRYLNAEQHKAFRENIGYSGLDFLEHKGTILGSVEIVDCVINHPSIWAERTAVFVETDKVILSETPIIYNWVLANPIKFPVPIPAKGRLSFWDYPNILAEPEEKDGDLFCHCKLPIKEIDQVIPFFDGKHKCRYCGGQWYK
jgi:hypothetical protein